VEACNCPGVGSAALSRSGPGKMLAEDARRERNTDGAASRVSRNELRPAVAPIPRHRAHQASGQRARHRFSWQPVRARSSFTLTARPPAAFWTTKPGGCRGRDLRHEADPVRCWVLSLHLCNKDVTALTHPRSSTGNSPSVIAYFYDFHDANPLSSGFIAHCWEQHVRRDHAIETRSL
jgi:hypothetical protein